jgi:putative acyl-CoA dehydrogenase
MTQTHEVTNQSTPFVDVNLFATDRALRDALRFHHPGFDSRRFEMLGVEVGSARMQAHARFANAHPPRLRTHDHHGRRLDLVEFDAGYHMLLTSALRNRLHAAPWSEGPGAHIERAAAFILFTQLEPSVLCPVSMSYAVTPALRANAAIHAEWAPKLVAPNYDGRYLPFSRKTAVTMGMGMTEKQGGSDVRANTTRAVPDGEDGWGRRYRLSGHKWFLSAPMCDAFMMLAQTEAGPTCFFVPRLLPDGTINPIRIQRLKDKLGNHANASSEVEFIDIAGWLVGEEGRGITQILEMGSITRLDCALGTAGLMRHALTLALHHCTQRSAFGSLLIEQPAMKNVLADLAIESAAATALAMRLARAVDRVESGQDPDGHEALMRRLLTPVAKFWICKRGSLFAQETMECLGGNGYVEAEGEGTMARIYREMPLNSIWEGAGNIMAIDLVRALRAGPVAEALAHELAPVRGADPLLDAATDKLLMRIREQPDEGQARRLARDVALVVQAALLRRHSNDAGFIAFCRSRLDGGADVFGSLPPGCDTDAIVARARPQPDAFRVEWTI